MTLKSYWELDYRGRFIRTLWMMIPFIILVIILLLLISAPITIAASVFLLFLLIDQLIYNYTKWRDKSNPQWQVKMDFLLGKMKLIPDKKAFALGLTLILITPILLFLMSNIFPISNWVKVLIEGIVCFFAFLFMFSASYKRHK